MTASLQKLRDYDEETARIFDDFFNLLDDFKNGKKGKVKDTPFLRKIVISLLIIMISLWAWGFIQLDDLTTKKL